VYPRSSAILFHTEIFMSKIYVAFFILHSENEEKKYSEDPIVISTKHIPSHKPYISTSKPDKRNNRKE
jgi:hypothetical protein